MYQTLFIIAYYGLFRIGELTSGSHPVCAKDVHIGLNKDKILFVLYTSKTHDEGSWPQKIKIKANLSQTNKGKTFFCPFKLSREYLKLRGNYFNDTDPFFVFHNNTPVKPTQANHTLKKALKLVNLNSKVYSFHSLRIGRALDMMKAGFAIEQIMLAGRWKSNAVFKYLRN